MWSWGPVLILRFDDWLLVFFRWPWHLSVHASNNGVSESRPIESAHLSQLLKASCRNRRAIPSRVPCNAFYSWPPHRRTSLRSLTAAPKFPRVSRNDFAAPARRSSPVDRGTSQRAFSGKFRGGCHCGSARQQIESAQVRGRRAMPGDGRGYPFLPLGPE